MAPGEVLRKFASLFRKERLDGDLDAELASHLDLAAEEHRRKGMPAEEARRQAALQLRRNRAIQRRTSRCARLAVAR